MASKTDRHLGVNRWGMYQQLSCLGLWCFVFGAMVFPLKIYERSGLNYEDLTS